LKKSLSIRERVFGPDQLGVCESLGNLSVLYESQGQYADAEPYRARCLDIREKTLGPDHPDVGQSLHEVARLYRKQDRHVEAERAYNRAVTAFGPNHPEVILAAITASEYEKAARALNLPVGDQEATAAAVRRTFFGRVTDLRWTRYRSNVSPSAGTVVIEGEATHGNDLWQPFAVQLVREGAEWKLRSISLLGLAWK
jgi:tetratricopeptide (TPR) repeat protein